MTQATKPQLEDDQFARAFWLRLAKIIGLCQTDWASGNSAEGASSSVRGGEDRAEMGPKKPNSAMDRGRPNSRIENGSDRRVGRASRVLTCPANHLFAGSIKGGPRREGPRGS